MKQSNNKEHRWLFETKGHEESCALHFGIEFPTHCSLNSSSSYSMQTENMRSMLLSASIFNWCTIGFTNSGYQL